MYLRRCTRRTRCEHRTVLRLHREAKAERYTDDEEQCVCDGICVVRK